MGDRSFWERAIPTGARAYRKVSTSLRLGGDLQRLLEDARFRIASVRLDAPELEIIPPPFDSTPYPATEPDGTPTAAGGQASAPGTPDAGSAPVRHRRRSDLLAAGIGAACAVLIAVAYRSVGLPALRSATTIPMGAAVGLTLSGRVLYTMDSTRQLLVSLGPDGQVIGMARFDEPGAEGLAAGNGGIWTSAAGGRISFRSAEQGFPLRRVYENPGRTPKAMAWDGLLLWVSDPAAESVYQYLPKADLNALRELPLLGLKPSALYREGDLLWVLDGPTRVLHRYRVGPMPTPVDQLSLAGRLDPQAQVAGMAVDDESLWILTRSPAILHRYTLDRLRWTPAPKPFAL